MRELPINIHPDNAQSAAMRLAEAYPGKVFETSTYGPLRPITLFVDDTIPSNEDSNIIALATSAANAPPEVPFNKANYSPVSLINRSVYTQWLFPTINPPWSQIS